MPSMPPRNIERLRADLQSPSADVRRNAMQVLSYWVYQDPSNGPAALPLFHHALRNDTDPWTVVTAAKGIGQTAGEAQGRAALLNLLERPEQDIVATAVLNLERELNAERLLELFSHATHTGLRRSLINVLGRKSGAADPDGHLATVFAVLIAAVDDPDLRPYAIVALEQFGDPAAIPHIERCLSDTAEAWSEDNHGPMLRVCDVASDAIGALRKSRERPAVPPRAVPSRAVGSGPNGATAALSRPAIAPAITTAGLRSAGIRRILDTLLPHRPESNGTIYAIAPLAAAIVTVPWVLMFVIGVISVTNKAHGSPDRTRAMDFFAILPPALGVALGLYGLVKRRIRGAARHATLILGLLLCVAVSVPFLNEARAITFAEQKAREVAPPPNPPAVRVPIPSGKPPPMEDRRPIDFHPPVTSQP